MPKLKKRSYGFANLPLQGVRFLAFGAFQGGLESVVLVTFLGLGKIFEQSILFSYMAAYGATSVPTNSVKLARSFATISGHRAKALKPKP